MYKLNTFGKYEMYCDTLNHAGTFLLESTEDDIGYLIFEELDGDFQAFLSDKNLKELLQNEYIDQHVYELSRKLHDMLEDISNSTLWELKYVTTAPEWLEILKLFDEIKEYQKKSDVGWFY